MQSSSYQYYKGGPLSLRSPTRSKFQEEFTALNFTERHPVGVCGLISPWNLPLYLLTFKMAPALVYGNTVVCKPSEMTSLTAFKLCELITQVGFPPGVVNMVFGTGPKAGQALVEHPLVPAISFTGSTATGTKIAVSTAPMMKKLSLEVKFGTTVETKTVYLPLFAHFVTVLNIVSLLSCAVHFWVELRSNQITRKESSIS
jgi:acyl-CoA reductase-like NAD-dependent aldehyde dehydrogenase